MARRFTRGVQRGAKRTNAWIGLTVGVDTHAASALSFLGSLNAAALALRPFTIIRTRFDLLFESDQTGAAEVPNGDLGMIVISDKAVAAGVTAIPGPISEIDEDWFVHQGLTAHFVFISGVGVDADAGHHYTIDSKAMRKVGLGDDMAIMFENNSAVGAATTMLGRMLVKLH